MEREKISLVWRKKEGEIDNRLRERREKKSWREGEKEREGKERKGRKGRREIGGRERESGV